MKGASQYLRHAQTLVLGHVRDAAHLVMGGSIGQWHRRRSLLRAVEEPRPLRVVLGGGLMPAPLGWYSTNSEMLDITRRGDWQSLLGTRRVDALLAERVWERLTFEQGQDAARQCRNFLQKGGTLRVAVPDGFHPDARYLDYVRPGGRGPGASGNRMLFDHRTLVAMLEGAGFHVSPLEYWDEAGRFHHEPWSAGDGPIERRPRFSPETGRFERNSDYARLNKDSITPKRRVTSEVWPFNFTSLIVDARLPQRSVEDERHVALPRQGRHAGVGPDRDAHRGTGRARTLPEQRRCANTI